MHQLHMSARDFGLANAETVKANYATLEEARVQGDANLASGKQVPLYITDDTGKKVFDYGALSAAEKNEIAEQSRAAARALKAQRIAEALNG